MKNRRPRIGLALGSGAARGWSHIGVIRALERAGVIPDIICGTSIGSLVGAIYAAGELDHFQRWVSELDWQDMVGMVDLRIDGGLIKGSKLVDFLHTRFNKQAIEQLPKTFACVATDLTAGREIWLREGSVVDAVRASIALPGLFSPALLDGRMLVDGGLVNPVPVSLCRALGADIVIAVDLNWDLLGYQRRSAEEISDSTDAKPNGVLDNILSSLRASLKMSNGPETDAEPDMPSMLAVMATSINIMQVRITQSRLAGEPADFLVRPRLSHIGAMDFHRGQMAIDEGERAAGHVLPGILELLG